MQNFDILAVHGPYGFEYTWATSEVLRSAPDKPCDWLHDIPNGTLLKCSPEYAFSVTVNDLASSSSIRNAAHNLLQLLYEFADTPANQPDAQYPADSVTRQLVIVSHGLSGFVVKQAILIALREPRFHFIVRRTSRLVFIGCPHRFSPSVTWEQLRFKIPAIYEQTTEPVARPLNLKPCSVDSAVLVSISTEFIAVATAYDIVNVYEANTENPTVEGAFCGTVGIPSENGIAYNVGYLALGFQPPGLYSLNESVRTFRKIKTAIYREFNPHNIGFQRTYSGYIALSKLLVRLGGLFYSPEEYAYATLVPCYPETFSWIAKEDLYQDWSHNGHEGSGARILHLYGGAGCGKTNLLAYIASSLRQRSPKTFIFSFSFSKTHIQRATVRNFLLDFLLQLTLHAPGLADLYVARSQESTNWTTDMLWVVFKKVLLVGTRPHVFCLIDDFDDANAEQRRLIGRITAAIDESNIQNSRLGGSIAAFKFLLTTTAKCSTTSGIPHFHSCIDLEAKKEFSEDKYNNIKSTIAKLIEKRPVLAPYAEELQKKLCAPGITMLQATLQLTIFEICIPDSTPNRFKREINAIPRTLEDCYEVIHLSFRPERDNFTGKALSWMFHAPRILNQSELATALAINSSQESFDEGDISGDLKSDLDSVVGPFVVVTGDEINFCHGSMRDYLDFCLRKSSKGRDLSFSTFDHAMAAVSCLSYLQSMLPKLKGNSKNILRFSPDGVAWLESTQEGMGLLQYAVTNWFYHYRQATVILESYSRDPQTRHNLDFSETLIKDRRSLLSRWISKFLNNKEIFDIWYELYCTLQEQCITQYLEANKAKERPWLVFLTENGLETLELQHNTDITALDNLECTEALELSLCAGFGRELQQQLFDHMTNEDIINLPTRMLLQASKSPHFQPRLQTILQTEDSSNITARKYQSLLCESAANGDASTFQWLAGIKINSPLEWTSDTPLRSAAALGDLAMVEVILAKQAEINLPHSPWDCGFPYSPLEAAAWGGHQAIIKYFTNQGANPIPLEEKNDGNLHALHLASITGYPQVVHELLGAGADVNLPALDSLPICFAAANGRAEIVKILIQKGAKVKGLGESYISPLWPAAKNGYSECTRLLLEAGAAEDKDLTREGYSPLQIACRSGHSEVVKVLVQYNADIDAYSGYALCLALDLTINDHSLDILHTLIQANASLVHRSWYSYGGTALHRVCISGQSHKLKILLESRNQLDLNIPDSSADTPLTEALRCRNSNHSEATIDTVKLLLEKGADPNRPGGGNERPLERAYDNFELTSMLLAKGARVDLDNWGSTNPIIYAIQYGPADVVSALLDAGTKPTTCDSYGRSCLYLAVYADSENIVKMLLKRGADPLEAALSPAGSTLERSLDLQRSSCVDMMLEHILGKNTEKHLLLAVTHSRHSPILVKTLLKHRIDNNKGNLNVNLLDNFGRTALFYAASSGYKETVKLLLEYGADTSLKDCDGRLARDVVSTIAGKELIWRKMEEAKGSDLEAPSTPVDLVNRCRFTRHDDGNEQPKWDVTWCVLCYTELDGFLYHCCDCSDDTYNICQDCYERKGRRCIGISHIHRKRFYKHALASYEEFCDWVDNLVPPGSKPAHRRLLDTKHDTAKSGQHGNTSPSEPDGPKHLDRHDRRESIRHEELFGGSLQAPDSGSESAIEARRSRRRWFDDDNDD